MNAWNKGKGKGIAWLREHVAYDGDECLTWPYARMATGGYGQLGFEYKQYYAHRMMCELAHGSAPTEKHHAAHNCGKGHEGCVNPRHLAWKTVTENLLDRKLHGTHRVGKEPRAKLTPKEVAEVRALKGKRTQSEIAEIFGVKRGCIQYWHKRSADPVPLKEETRDRREKMRAAWATRV